MAGIALKEQTLQQALQRPDTGSAAQTDPNAWADAADLEILAQIGLSAAVRGFIGPAEAIFDALAICRPDNAAAAIGHGLCAIARRDFDTAIRILGSEQISRQACAAEAQALLALALSLAGRMSEALPICQKLAAGSNEAARRVGQLLLERDASHKSEVAAP